jgi:hypothetical protein
MPKESFSVCASIIVLMGTIQGTRRMAPSLTVTRCSKRNETECYSSRKLAGYYHLVPSGQKGSAITSSVRCTIHKRTRMLGELVKLLPTPIKLMKTTKRRAAARKNIKTAASAAKRKRTISHLPKKVRTALGKEGAKAARKKRAANSP